MNILAWNAPPPTAELARAIAAHEKPLYLAVCLPDLSLPEFRPSESPSALEQALQQAINAQSGCIQFNGVNALNDILPDVHLWLLPPPMQAACTSISAACALANRAGGAK